MSKLGGILPIIIIVAGITVALFIPSWSMLISMWNMARNTSAFAQTGQWQDGREQAALNFVTSHAIAGNPVSVLDYLSQYNYKQSRLVHIGDDKGKVVTDLIAKHNIQTVIELGTYIGYSSILMGSKNADVYTIDISKANQKIAAEMATFAGSEIIDRITFIEGTVKSAFKTLKAQLGEKHVDMILIDHHKPSYKSDLIFLENMEFIKKDCIVVADNIMYEAAWFKAVLPFTPWAYMDSTEYTDYVRNSDKYTSNYLPFGKDGLEISIKN
eukprot:344885_1